MPDRNSNRAGYSREPALIIWQIRTVQKCDLGCLWLFGKFILAVSNVRLCFGYLTSLAATLKFIFSKLYNSLP